MLLLFPQVKPELGRPEHKYAGSMTLGILVTSVSFSFHLRNGAIAVSYNLLLGLPDRSSQKVVVVVVAVVIHQGATNMSYKSIA